MGKRILWVEDDYYAIKGLVRPLEKNGFEIDVAKSAEEGYRKIKSNLVYDLIIVDLILPPAEQAGHLPAEIRHWEEEEFLGVGFTKWLMLEQKVTCPVIILSVVYDPIHLYDLEYLGLAGYLTKKGLHPSTVKTEVFRILGIEDSPTIF